MHLLLLLLLASCRLLAAGEQSTALAFPRVTGELATPTDIYRALRPAWDSFVEERNSAGLVDPKQEGKPQAPLGEEEAAFQFERTQRGAVDSARLLLVFGLIPSARHMDAKTLETMLHDHAESGDESQASSTQESSSALATLDPNLRYPDGTTPLHHAAAFGIITSMRRFLDDGADVNVTASSGVQPIHAAAIMGHVAAVELLANRGADVNARHLFASSTPMHFAAEMGHPGVVRRLCELRADVEAEKKQGGTPLHISADSNNAAVARVLVEPPCNSDPNAILLGDTSPLYLAAGRGFPDIIRVLSEAGAQLDRTLFPGRPNKKKKKKKVESKELVNAEDNPANFLPGSNPNAPGWEEGNGATALHNAAENGHLAAVSALLDAGARQLSTMEGVTPLITALQYKHPKIAVALLDSKTSANVNVMNPKDGQTALHIAAAYDYPEVAARALLAGGRVDVKDRRGNTPSDYTRGQLVRWLLGRYEGRDPRLDDLVRSRSENLPERLRAARGAEPALRERYAKYAARLQDGTLNSEGARLAGLLSSGSLTAQKRLDVMRRFSVLRFMLAGGSDVPIAVEALMHKTEAAATVAMVILGVKMHEIRYEAGKEFKINGHDVFNLTQEIIQAARSSAERGDSSDVEALVHELKEAVHIQSGVAAASEEAEDAEEADEGEPAEPEDRLEL